MNKQIFDCTAIFGSKTKNNPELYDGVFEIDMKDD